MKKIVSIVVLMFAFGLSANAQSNLKITDAQTQTSKSKNLAYKNAKELSSFLNLSPETSKNFVELFITRDEALTNAKTEEEKSVVYTQFEKKLLSYLNDDQLKKLSSNKDFEYKLKGRKE